MKSTNKVAVLNRPRHIEIEEREMPVPDVGEVLVEIQSVGICGSDIHYYEHGRIGDFVVEYPLVLGHEASGVVRKLGAKTKDLKIGDRVTIEPQKPCGECASCMLGNYNLCKYVEFMATPPHDGAFAKFVVHPEKFTFKIPDEMDFDEAALIEPLAVAYQACSLIDLQPASHVLVIGAGPIGHLCGQVAIARGAAKVVITDIDADRLQKVSQYKGFEAHNGRKDEEYANLGEFEYLIECSGASQALNRAVRKLGPRAKVALVGINPTQVGELDCWEIIQREATIQGVFRYANVYPKAIELVKAGMVDLGFIISGSYPLVETARAVEQCIEDRKTLKTIVHPQA